MEKSRKTNAINWHPLHTHKHTHTSEDRSIQLSNPLLVSKWIQLLEPLLAIPLTCFFTIPPTTRINKRVTSNEIIYGWLKQNLAFFSRKHSRLGFSYLMKVSISFSYFRRRPECDLRGCLKNKTRFSFH